MATKNSSSSIKIASVLLNEINMENFAPMIDLVVELRKIQAGLTEDDSSLLATVQFEKKVSVPEFVKPSLLSALCALDSTQLEQITGYLWMDPAERQQFVKSCDRKPRAVEHHGNPRDSRKPRDGEQRDGKQRDGKQRKQATQFRKGPVPLSDYRPPCIFVGPAMPDLLENTKGVQNAILIECKGAEKFLRVCHSLSNTCPHKDGGRHDTTLRELTTSMHISGDLRHVCAHIVCDHARQYGDNPTAQKVFDAWQSNRMTFSLGKVITAVVFNGEDKMPFLQSLVDFALTHKSLIDKVYASTPKDAQVPFRAIVVMILERNWRGALSAISPSVQQQSFMELKRAFESLSSEADTASQASNDCASDDDSDSASSAGAE